MIRKANDYDSRTLTEVAFASKKYWNYPEKYFNLWKEELTITEDYIKNNIVYVDENEGIVSAFYSVVELKNDIEYKNEKIEAGIWLDHMFVVPDSIGKGIGGCLFNHCVNVILENGWKKFRILSDPNAKNFYIKQGCTYIREFPSSVEERTTPLLEYRVDG